MPLKRKIKTKKKPKSATSPRLDRAIDLLMTGHGTTHDAKIAAYGMAKNAIARMQSIAAKAEELRTWKFMEGCYLQAADLYLTADYLYRNFHEAEPLLSDTAYDKLGTFLQNSSEHLPPSFNTWFVETTMGFDTGSPDEENYSSYIIRAAEYHAGMFKLPKKRRRLNGRAKNKAPVLRPSVDGGSSGTKDKAGRVTRIPKPTTGGRRRRRRLRRDSGTRTED